MSKRSRTGHAAVFAALVLGIVVMFGTDAHVQTATVYYVRAGASGSGSGSDWTNAYPALPTTLVRGATYYVADGTYPAYHFDTPASGTAMITVKKATANDHGTGTGWSSSYGDGQATFGQWQFETNYWTLDGNSPTWSYGFVVSGSCDSVNSCIDIGVGQSSSVGYVTLKGVSSNPRGAAHTDSMHFNGCNDVLVQNVESWNADADLITIESCRRTVFDHVYFHTRNDAGVGEHADAFEIWSGDGSFDDNVIRYSVIDWGGQQVFWGGVSNGNVAHGRWDIYGNQFYDSTGSGSSKGLHPQSGNVPTGPIYVYNNTFVNLNISMDFLSNTTGVVQNNIFYNASAPTFGSAKHDYNFYKSGMSTQGESHARTGSDPFVSLSGDDYRLRVSTGAGIVLSTPYTTDPVGKARGSDGVWDMGAFEYGGTAGGTAPSPPTSVRVIR